MLSQTVIRGVSFEPALFCAPLAGITHSAFRRLASEFGGCGGFWTEMLAAREVLKEDPKTSPWLKRSATEKRVIYQLMVRKDDPVEEIVARLAAAGADGVDINLACHAPVVRNVAAGSGLFEDAAALAEILGAARRCWPGLLTVKIRLGRDKPGWESRFEERLKLFEAEGVDAVILHPRFFEDKFKRRARHELLPWATSLTRVPLIANGDITGPETIARHPDRFEAAKGLMIGRMAAAKPWIFAAWNEPLEVDYAEVWRRMSEYIRADFPEKQALGRLKIFTRYYARNFKFGHHFNVAVHNAPTMDAACEAARAFLDRNPAINPDPPLMGIA